MKKEALLIMLGGSSSRMKKSLKEASISEHTREIAAKVHKSLVPVGPQGQPLLYYLLRNAAEAEVKEVYLITAAENQAFQEFLDYYSKEEFMTRMEIHFAIQWVLPPRTTPWGTADAVWQCLEQYPRLQKQRFTVCNGDNLYSKQAFQALMIQQTHPNAMIAYEGGGLGHPIEKIRRFSLLDFNRKHQLISILEKPDIETMTAYSRKHQSLWVSMNIFNFTGERVFPFLRDCPEHTIRREKELPTAVLAMSQSKGGEVLCIPLIEKVPDLTSAQDILGISDQLEG
jgi:dTDP-glucose pyrophosphorylase